MGGAFLARRTVLAVSATVSAVIVVLDSLSTGPSSEASVARDNTFFFRDLIARAGDLVSARGSDARALTQRATMDHDARVARVAAPAIAVPGSEIWVEAKLTNTEIGRAHV